jgi:hypothetical protein
MTSSSRRRRVTALFALAVAAATTIAVGALATVAGAQGVSQAILEQAGWACFPSPSPPVSGPARNVCANPGLGRPFPGPPDRPSYMFLAFSQLDGSYLGTLHLIRYDLYAGQPCGPTGGPYEFRPRIGYYECQHY